MKKLLLLLTLCFSTTIISMHLGPEYQTKAPPSPKFGQNTRHAKHESYVAADQIKTILKEINCKNKDETMESIKKVLNNESLTSPFFQEVVKILAGQIYTHNTRQKDNWGIPYGIPCQVTVYFDGREEACSFFAEGGCCEKTYYDPNNSPWLQLTRTELLRKLISVTHKKNKGKPYPESLMCASN